MAISENRLSSSAFFVGETRRWDGLVNDVAKAKASEQNLLDRLDALLNDKPGTVFKGPTTTRTRKSK